MSETRETVSGTAAGRDFWRRQFEGSATAPQLAYDVVFGIVMPILCFVFDPIVFSGSGFAPSTTLLAGYRFPVYLLSALSITGLAAWLLTRRAVKSAGGFIAGVLMSGALCSLVIGVLILPLTLIGLLFVIGFLGFTPFFTAFVYLRNGVRAMKRAEFYASHRRLTGSLLLAALLVIALPFAAHAGISRTVSRAIGDLTKGDPRAADGAVRRLRYVGRWADLDEVVWAYSKEQDPARKQNLARAYKEITGDDVGTRLAMLLD